MAAHYSTAAAACQAALARIGHACPAAASGIGGAAARPLLAAAAARGGVSRADWRRGAGGLAARRGRRGGGALARRPTASCFRPAASGGSAFMMLIAGIEAADGKSYLPDGGGAAPVVATCRRRRERRSGWRGCHRRRAVGHATPPRAARRWRRNCARADWRRRGCGSRKQLERRAVVRGAAAGREHMGDHAEAVGLDRAAQPLDRGLIAAVARGQLEAVGQQRKPRIHIGHRGGDRLRTGEQRLLAGRLDRRVRHRVEAGQRRAGRDGAQRQFRRAGVERAARGGPDRGRRGCRPGPTPARRRPAASATRHDSAGAARSARRARTPARRQRTAAPPRRPPPTPAARTRRSTELRLPGSQWSKPDMTPDDDPNPRRL